MKNKAYIAFITILLYISCVKSQHTLPKVELTKAFISGKIIPPTDNKQFPTVVHYFVPLPVSGKIFSTETKTDSIGNFTLEVGFEVFPSICAINTNINPNSTIYVRVDQQKLNIGIHYDLSNNINYVDGVPSSRDAIEMPNVIEKLSSYRSGRPRTKLYDKNPEYLPLYADTIINERLHLFVDSSEISEEMKRVVTKEFKLQMYTTHLFDYEQEMKLNYTNLHNKTPDSTLSFKTPTKKYYSFLQKMDLNNPEYLNCFSYPEFIETIFNNETLAIPPIAETPIKEWLGNVKRDFIPLTGLKDGLFYDMLLANAYSYQLNKQVKPISGIQKAQIISYFKNKSFTTILLAQSDSVSRQQDERMTLKVNEVPRIKDSSQNPQGRIIDEIVGLYKNKVVVIDFWATWCGPCKVAQTKMKAIKNELAKEDVVFVYVTNGSSPKKLWLNEIQSIGGVHYYLSAEQWASISNSKSYGFEVIPTYLLFGRDGNLIKKMIGYPGNEAFKKMIQESINLK